MSNVKGCQWRCCSPAKSGSNEGRVAEHGCRAQEGAQAQRSGQGWGRAVMGRRGEPWEGSGCSSGSSPGRLQSRVGVGREGPPLQVVAEGVGGRQRARERQAGRVGLDPRLLTLPPLSPTVLKPHLRSKEDSRQFRGSK